MPVSCVYEQGKGAEPRCVTPTFHTNTDVFVRSAFTFLSTYFFSMNSLKPLAVGMDCDVGQRPPPSPSPHCFCCGGVVVHAHMQFLIEIVPISLKYQIFILL